jgi:dolichyl-phosphate beta-glucosyltransferase
MVPTVSIVIPAYNEASRLGRTLSDVVGFLSDYGAAELLVVDDGSTDGTGEAAERYLTAHVGRALAWRVIRLASNHGKGYAVRQGLLAARAPVALFSDADLSTPITELPKLVDPITSGHCDIVFGSRAINRRLIETRQPFYRDRAGRLFNATLRLATGLPFLDTQCGFKAFRLSVCRAILQSAVVDRFGFDVELLFVAYRGGLRLQEVPVRWHHHEGSKVRLSRDGPRMLADIVLVRRRMMAGRYNAAMSAATAAALLERQWAPHPVRARLAS